MPDHEHSKITIDDENGNLFDGWLARGSDPETNVRAWAEITGDNGFGQPVGQISLLTNLKKLPNGHYGA